MLDWIFPAAACAQSAEEFAEIYGAPPEPETITEVAVILLSNDVTGSFIFECLTLAALAVLISAHRTILGVIHGAAIGSIVPPVLALGALFGCATLAITEAVSMSQAVQLGMGTAMAYAAHVGFSTKRDLGDMSSSGMFGGKGRRGGGK